MDFIDLKQQQKRIRARIEERIETVLDHGRYIMGPEVQELETRLTDYVGCKHAVGCASGTDALLMALMTHNVGPGDAVFTTPFTFIATAEIIALIGATPVFVDIDPLTFNIDPPKIEDAVQAINSQDSSIYPIPSGLQDLNFELRPKGIIAVDLFGLPADYDLIEDIANRHGLFVIEDAAQSFGAEYKEKKSCRFGTIAATSFFPAKPLGGYGDGGMCFTDDDNLAKIMKSIRVHGKGSDKYDNIRVGLNARLDTLQAAILLAKFDIFPEEIELREQAARRYTKQLLASPIIPPEIPASSKSAWAQYSVLARDAKECTTLQSRLKNEGIPTAVYYPTPLHLQTAFQYLGYRKGDFPVSENVTSRIFSLPFHPYLSPEDQIRITDLLVTGVHDADNSNE